MKKTTNSSPYQFEGRITLCLRLYPAWTAACYGYVHRKPNTSFNRLHGSMGAGGQAYGSF